MSARYLAKCPGYLPQMQLRLAGSSNVSVYPLSVFLHLDQVLAPPVNTCYECEGMLVANHKCKVKYYTNAGVTVIKLL